MNSTQRVLNLFKGCDIDRIPISTHGLIGWNLDEWYNNTPSYKTLMDSVRESTDCLYITGYNVVEHDNLQYDSKSWRENNHVYTERSIKAGEKNFSILQREDDGVHTQWMLKHMLQNEEELDEYIKYRFPVDLDESSLDISDYKKAVAYLDGRNGIPLIQQDEAFGTSCLHFSYQDGMMFCYDNEEKFKRLCDLNSEVILKRIEIALKAGLGPVWRICGAELGVEPYFSSDKFSRLCLENLEKIIALIHKYGMFARVHCHGRVKNRLADFVAIGADAIDPIEPPDQGDVKLEEVFDIVGNKAVVFGNLEYDFLSFAEKDDIRKYVKNTMEIAKRKNARFCIMPTAEPLEDNIPLKLIDNYLTFIDASLEYGKL